MSFSIFFFVVFVLGNGAFIVYKYSVSAQHMRDPTRWYEDLADELVFAITGDREVVEARKKVSELDRAAIEVILKRHNTYYQKLSARGKIKFQRRLLYHYREKRYFAKDGLNPTREMKVVLSAAAAQLTYGLDDYELSRFHTYVLYPDIFQLRRGMPFMKGGTISAGVVYFSWKHVKHGFRVEDDGVNLAIHELAHALKIQGHFGLFSFEYWVDDLNVWLEKSARSIEIARIEDREFFRKDMLKDAHERFATAVEAFFEQPEEFNQRFPEIFLGLSKLLNQDPRNPNDYRLALNRFS